MTIESEFLALFAGNDRSSGRWNPQTEKVHTEYLPLDEAAIEAHLTGKVGVGSVPIMDDGTCRWGAIDIDNHGTDEDLPIFDVDRLVTKLGLPLVLCRSKSGGIHAYAFFEQAQPASKVKSLLEVWAEKIGYKGSEIFPKQARLVSRDGKTPFGNWINLPYFREKATMRYAVVDGKKLELQEFIAAAKQRTITSSKIAQITMADHPDAPPCIQMLMVKGIPQGQRNEGMYNVAVYLRKRDPDTAQTEAMALNKTLFTSALPKSELMRTVQSAMKPEYSYRCGEEVIKKYCDRDECLKRKCGITLEEATSADTFDSLPVFTELAKYLTEPPRWEMVVNGVRIFNIDTEQLLDWRAIRRLIADRLTMVVPMIKNQEWERMLQPLMQNVRLIETPDDASVNGIIRDRLREFCAKADLLSRGEVVEDRKAIVRGMPVVQVLDGERCVVFRGQDFVAYLKRTKSEELKGVNLWFAVQDMGVLHKKLRMGGRGSEQVNVWYVPVRTVVMELAAEPVEFKSEI